MGLLLLLTIPAAWGDIFSYTDTAGVVHFSNVPTDSHYTLAMAEPTRNTAPVSPTVNKTQLEPIIEQAAQRASLHPALVRAVIQVESGWDAHAVSSRGAKGLMQLEPQTAARYGAVDIFDPGQNVGAGTRYLRDLLTRYDGRLELALAAYNAGEQAVEHYGGRIPPFAETQRYVPAVIRAYKTLLARTDRSSSTGRLE